MKKLHHIYIIVCLLPLTGCVTSKVYRQTKAELLGYQASYGAMATRADSLSRALAQMQTEIIAGDDSNRLAELENLLAKREAALFEINQIIEDALAGFNGRGLTVTRHNGHIYVSLEDKLLFESGKAELSSEGVRAVRDLARVLENNSTINITVEGHTDNTGYITKPGAQIVDNWDLSCKRATEVVRVMLKNSSINPARITASGRSQYKPISSGNSSAARAQNRRTEIIITPQLDQIMELLNKSK